MAISPPVPTDLTGLFHVQVTPAPYPLHRPSLSLLDFKYGEAVEQMQDMEDAATFPNLPKCPGCGRLATQEGRGTSKSRVCKCGHEFWKLYSRYDIANKRE